MKALIAILFILTSINAIAQKNPSTYKGNLAYLQGQFERSEKYYKDAAKTDVDTPIAKYNLGNALQRQNKFDEAIVVLEVVGNSDASERIRSQAWYNQGVGFTKQKNLEGSIESYKKAIRLNPGDQEARENLQKALLEQKKQLEQQNLSKKPQPKISEKETDQKLKDLRDKEKKVMDSLQKKTKQGKVQAEDW